MQCSKRAKSTTLSRLGDADRSQRLRIAAGGYTTAADPGKGRHAGVVPTVDVALLDQSEELSFAQHRVAEIESGELDLTRRRGTDKLSMNQS